ncbi:MAG: hypothetical protein M3362_26430 [Acidobacteriota bacterium]|nr:hypothetical protein [Acidobacteriota bacterium]
MILAVVLAKLSATFIHLPQPLLSILAGVLVALLPNIFEYFILYRAMNVEKAKSPLVKGLLKLDLAIVHKFAGAINTRLEQDTYDLESGWGLDLTQQLLSRRIRQTYQYYAKEIARKRRDPALLRLDVNASTYEQFYLLTEYLGRKRLRKALANPLPARFLDWDGRERRRIYGSTADRSYPDTDSSRNRIYDDPMLLRTESQAGAGVQVSPLISKNQERGNLITRLSSLLIVIIGIIISVVATSVSQISFSRIFEAKSLVTNILTVMIGYILILIAFAIITRHMRKGSLEIRDFKKHVQSAFLRALDNSMINPNSVSRNGNVRCSETEGIDMPVLRK